MTESEWQFSDVGDRIYMLITFLMFVTHMLKDGVCWRPKTVERSINNIEKLSPTFFLVT